MEHFKEIGERLSNWKRWGSDDQRGTLNFITPGAILAAATCIRSGKVFDLSIPVGSDGPQTGVGGRINPLHVMTVMPTDDLGLGDGLRVSDDFISMPLQGATQWDSLAHVGYDERFYNDVPVTAVSSLRGATRNGIDRVCPGVVGRGVLVDVARHRGVEWLDGGEAIEPEELNILIRDMGMLLGEILDLEALAEDCAADGLWDFFLAAPPLRVVGGVGSPVSPLAVK